MKTTLILRDDLVRRAKARAALRGQTLSGWIEEGLERRLREEEARPPSLAEWLHALPVVDPGSVADLEATLAAADFREIDEDQWR